MTPTKPPRNQCPNDDPTPCNLHCRYNHFENDDLTIDSWELRCLDCGYRETIAFRSDEEEPDEPVNPRACPFCPLKDLPPGRNPCKS